MPLVVQEEELRLRAEVAKGQGDLQAALDFYADAHARHQERRELDAETHALELARRRRSLLEEQIALRRLETELKNAGGQGDTPGTGDAFNDYLRTEHEVRRNRSAASRRIEQIYLRAAAERRQLTREEWDEIAALDSASDAAEAHIRRGAAADF